MPRVVVKFTQQSLGVLCAALMAHAGRLNSLLEPSWPDAEKVHKEMYNLVHTLMIHGVGQKWFNAFALIEGAEVMVGGPADDLPAKFFRSFSSLRKYLQKSFVRTTSKNKRTMD